MSKPKTVVTTPIVNKVTTPIVDKPAPVTPTTDATDAITAKEENVVLGVTLAIIAAVLMIYK